MAQKRKYRRRPLHVTVRVHDQEGAGEIEFDTHDLSLGGAFLKSDLLFELGDVLDIELRLNQTVAPLLLKARVVRASRDSSRPGMGIAFEPVSDEVKQAIDDFLHR